MPAPLFCGVSKAEGLYYGKKMNRAPSRTPPSVLFVGSFLEGAALERYPSADLGKRLAVLGWPVRITSRKPSRLLRLADMLTTVWRLRNMYDLAVVDVFSGSAFLWAEAVVSLLRMLGKPFALTLHGGNLPAFAQECPRRIRRLLGPAQVVTTPSGYLLAQMQGYRQGLRLLPNAIELACYPFRVRPNPRAKLVWLRAFEKTYNPIMAIQTLAALVGTLNARQQTAGPGVLPSHLRTLFFDLTLTMYGPDKRDGSLASLKAETQRLRLNQLVRISGQLQKTDVADALSQGDIFLNTANVDNAPVSVLEAMACGLCVVSTNVGGLRYLIDHERNGLLVPAGDASAMALAVWRILS